jgi:hypothetical protein
MGPVVSSLPECRHAAELTLLSVVKNRAPHARARRQWINRGQSCFTRGWAVNGRPWRGLRSSRAWRYLDDWVEY